MECITRLHQLTRRLRLCLQSSVSAGAPLSSGVGRRKRYEHTMRNAADPNEGTSGKGVIATKTRLWTSDARYSARRVGAGYVKSGRLRRVCRWARKWLDFSMGSI